MELTGPHWMPQHSSVLRFVSSPAIPKEIISGSATIWTLRNISGQRYGSVLRLRDLPATPTEGQWLL